jgi:DNA repair exonuclease SbcCD ATPase subunit
MAWRLLPFCCLLLAACAGGRTTPPVDARPPDDSERLVRRAEAAVQAGAYAEAARLFAEAIDGPHPAFADRALVGLTRLLVCPDYPGRDYRQAYLVADRLRREHPQSRYADEARAWRELLLAYLTRDRELEQRARELEERTRESERRAQELERLRGVDAALERRAQELDRVSQELRRLKILDAELERRTQELERLTYELERRTQELDRLKRLDLELEQQKRKP